VFRLCEYPDYSVFGELVEYAASSIEHQSIWYFDSRVDVDTDLCDVCVFSVFLYDGFITGNTV
jgi:hypothetical protein